MSTKHLFSIALVASLLSCASVRAQNQTETTDLSSTSRNSQPAAPILHRRTTLPAGWFKQGQASGALTNTQVSEVQPAAHFDTLGPTDEAAASGGGAAQRLKRIRTGIVLEQTETAATPPATDSVQAESSTSSRRPNSPNVPSSQVVIEADASPAAKTPKTSTDEQAVTKDTGTAATGNDETTGIIPGVDTLPSVMKRPESTREIVVSAVPEAVEAKAAGEPMKLIAIDPNAKADVASAAVVAERIGTDGGETAVDSHPDADPAAGASAVLIEHESPVLSVITRGPKTMVVGKSATYVVDLNNRSGVAAKDVIVRMNIPQWVEIVQQTTSNGVTHVRPDDAGNAILAWRVDRLEGHGQEKLMLDLIPRGNRPLELGVTWTFSPAHSVTQIEVKEPKLQISVVGAQDVLFGETKVYTITVSNPGTGDAENVVLSLMPLVAGEKPAGVRPLGTIAAGTRQTMEVELTARQTGRLEIRAEVAGDGGLMARGQQAVLVRRAALEIQVQGPPMKYAGTRAHYAIRVANTGDAPATDVLVLANLPAGAKEVTSSDGGSFDPNGGQIQWQLGLLRPGATRVCEMECTLMSPGDNRVDIRTVAAGDLSALGSTVTQVESLADLKLTVNDPQGAVAVGSDVTYEVRVQNRGTKAAENIQLFGYFSEGIEPIGVGGWKGDLREGEVALEAIPRLGAGQEMLLRITARASRAGDHVFRAELECIDPQTKLAVEEWTRFYGDQVPTRQADRRRSPPPTSRTPAPPQPLRVPR